MLDVESDPQQLGMFDSAESRRLRDEGIRRVHRSGFSAAVAAVVATMVGRIVKGEHIRAECIKHGVEAHHPNAWGGVVQGLARRGRLRWTGEYEPAEAKRTHAHPVKVYEVMP